MKKALLLYPEFSPFGFWNYKDVCKFMGAKYPAAPLGLITLAALLPRHWDMKLVDMNTTRLDDSLIDWADLVFIGGMLSQQTQFLNLIDRVHTRGKKVVAGGPDPTSQPEVYQRADYLVVGEAENIIHGLLSDMERGVQSGVYRSERRPDITGSPVPHFDLLNLRDYLMIGIQLCRGCPFNCEFCDIIELYGKQPRSKTPEQVVRELEMLYQLGYRGHVDFVDDNFIGNKAKVKQTLYAIKEWSEKRNFPFFYSTEASINLADDEELLGLMRDIDFRYVFIGIESPDENVLSTIRKKQNLNRNLVNEITKIHRYGIIVNAGFIIGFDNETSASVRKIVDTINDGAICLAMVGLLYALPNTQLTRRLEKENRLMDNHGVMDIENPQIDQASSGLNFITRRPRTEILHDLLHVLNNIYGVNEYFDRCLKLAGTLKTRCVFKPSFKKRLSHVRAFIKVAMKVGSRYPTCYYFWRNLFITLFTHPSSIESVLNFMAMYVHLDKQTKFITKLMHEKLIVCSRETVYSLE